MGSLPSMGALGYNVKDLSDAGVASVPAGFVQSESAQEAFTPHDEARDGGVPVVDFSGLQDGHPRRDATLAAIASACGEWGFFQVVNCGIPPSSVDRVQRLAREFFDLPAEEKEALARDPSNPVSTGYGRQFLLSANSTEDWQDLFFHYLLPAGLKQVERWPRNPAAYREAMETYADGILELTERLLDALGEVLGLRAGYLHEVFGEAMLNVRLNFYAACPEPRRVLGLRAHSDPNVMTVVAQDQVGGLQVKKTGKQWVNVTPIPGALVVNLGDQMQIVSNGRFRSVEHRVVTNPGAARLSVAVFRHASGGATVGPAAELVDELHPALYPATNYTAYRLGFHRDAVNGKVLP